jgi:hypothetical protein
MRMTKPRDLDPKTRKLLLALRTIMRLPDRERLKWLRELDRVLARPAVRNKARRRPAA